MNLHRLKLLSAATVSLGILALSATAAEPEQQAPSAGELASRLSANQQDGNALVRVKIGGAGAKSPLQVQIKSRATRAGTDLVYQVMWPKERKGEAVLLHASPGGAASGTLFTPPNTTKSISAGQMSQPLLGTDLTLEDAIENPYAWDQQSIVGNEEVNRINCAILESKPGKGARSSYSSIRTWVDTRRLVPLRIEKYGSGGKLVRRIDVTRVATDDKDRYIPANITVHGPGGGGGTEIDGSRIKHGVNFTDQEFTPEGLKELQRHDSPEREADR